MGILPATTAAFAGQPDLPLNPCEQAGIAAERAMGLPSGLLLAIGRVESGRWDPASGRVTAWPWTINAAGKGQWFETKEMAAQTVAALLDGGTRSIDVGCFQVNLLYHPLAFASLGQAFDPDANARYAARFLLSLYGRAGSWEAAVEAYHSADPTLGFTYRRQVFSAWYATPVMAAAMSVHIGTVPVPTAPQPIPVVIAGVRVWTPAQAGTAPMIVAMPGAPGTEGNPPVENTAAALPLVSYRVIPRR